MIGHFFLLDCCRVMAFCRVVGRVNSSYSITYVGLRTLWILFYGKDKSEKNHVIVSCHVHNVSISQNRFALLSFYFYYCNCDNM